MRIGNKILKIIVLSILIGACSKGEKSIEKDGLSSITISEDGRKIIYSWVENGIGSIYEANLDGSNPEILHKANNISFANPRISAGGKKIVLTGHHRTSVNSAIWIMNRDGTGLKSLTDMSAIRPEAVLSLKEDTVFFLQANSYEQYSPIGRRAAHNFDIYNIALDNPEITRMTNLNAYGLYYLSNLSADQLLFSAIDNNRGICVLSRSSNSLRHLDPINRGDRDLISYGLPVVLDSNQIACNSYYELLLINLQDNTEKFIGRSPVGQFSRLCYNQSNQRLYFTVTGEKNSVFSVKLDGSDLIESPFSININ
ncbi:hypothetical protein GXP67_16225 [Rhodocytophaga rosea]|uniref:DUF5050 domain-containing protein n=1 Tax=Rhodocytophaga rosea TaxID=2704465 RepID=A0A6C0GJ65_9BACT|nr:hypothetical protein [Rhodocytophaga rosea]QHT68076.1 hypothetical protein GXP67_16225 [Rhodocytophaga rosea]